MACTPIVMCSRPKALDDQIKKTLRVSRLVLVQSNGLETIGWPQEVEGLGCGSVHCALCTGTVLQDCLDLQTNKSLRVFGFTQS